MAKIYEIPESFRANYNRAMSGKSKSAAIKAKCGDCPCWQRAEIENCTVTQCPLYPYRPYQVKGAKRRSNSKGINSNAAKALSDYRKRKAIEKQSNSEGLLI
jgi:Zn-finger protein